MNMWESTLQFMFARDVFLFITWSAILERVNDDKYFSRQVLKNIHVELNSVNFIFKKKACLIHVFNSLILHTKVLYLQRHLMLYIYILMIKQNTPVLI